MRAARAARDIAAEALTIETRDHQENEATLRTVATALAVLLALGILAMTVGLIRGEAAGDLRTLTATGATGRTRRTLTAATAGSLAFLGVMLGTVGAYAALAAGFIQHRHPTPVPVLSCNHSGRCRPPRCRRLDHGRPGASALARRVME